MLCATFTPNIAHPPTNERPLATSQYLNPSLDPTILELSRRGHPLSFPSPFRSARNPLLTEPTLLGSSIQGWSLLPYSLADYLATRSDLQAMLSSFRSIRRDLSP